MSDVASTDDARDLVTLCDVLEAGAKRQPDSPCLVTHSVALDYATSFALVQRFGAELTRLGVEPGQHVALVGRNTAGYVIAWLACMRIGAIAVTVNDRLTGDALRYVVDQSDARAMVVEGTWAETSLADLSSSQREMPTVRLPDDSQLDTSLGQLKVPRHEVHRSDLSTIVYTSGTTGLPKGVMCSHGVYITTGRQMRDALQLTAMDRILVYLPLCHANPQMYAVGGALAAGGSVAIEPGFAAEGFFKRASRLGATGMTFIGTTLALLVQKNPQGERNHGLRFAVGGDIRLETVHAVDELFGITVHEVYGSTEMGGFVSCNTKNAMRRGSGGRVRGDMTLRIVDAEGRELQSDEVGHIALRPEQPDIMFSGYYNKPEETLKQIKDFWYYPGDLGKIDADGYVYFQGRNDDRIRRGGEMISPVQVEAYLSTVPGVLECAVVGVPDVVMGEEVKATVVVDRQIDPRVLADTVERLGGRFMVPRYIEFASSLPRTETGKVQRRLLKTLNAATHDSRAGGARCG